MSRLGHEGGDVVGLDAAAVEDAHRVRAPARRGRRATRWRMKAWTSCACAGVATLPGADGPDRLVGHERPAPPGSAARARAAPVRPGARRPPSSCPPRARPGSLPRTRWARGRGRARPPSSSRRPRRSRRRTGAAPSGRGSRGSSRRPRSITGETSPVKAPSFSGCMFWPARPTPLPRSASATAGSDVKGGATTTSRVARASPSPSRSCEGELRRLGHGLVHLPVAGDQDGPPRSKPWLKRPGGRRRRGGDRRPGTRGRRRRPSTRG